LHCGDVQAQRYAGDGIDAENATTTIIDSDNPLNCLLVYT